MEYTIEGTMNIKPTPRKFSKTIEAESEKMALEKLYADFGSRHKLKRARVKVLKVEQAK